MIGYQIISTLSYFDDIYPYFEGIFSVDDLPKVLPETSFLIFNLSTKVESGSHWVSLFRHSGWIELFDPLGVDSIKEKKLMTFIPYKKVIANISPVQSQFSKNCGVFCIYQVINRYLNLDQSFEELLNCIFSEHPAKNEIAIQSFFDDYGFVNKSKSQK